VALAFARAGLTWDDALVVSAHGRAGGLRRAANACRAHPKVAVLTGPGAGPAEIARELAPTTPRTFIVCEDLGGENERVSRPRMGEATTRVWRDPNVLIVLDPSAERRSSDPERHAPGPGWIAGPRPGPSEWALPEDAFEHRDSMISKAEVRAFALAKLGPRVGDLVWDVGAGSGSVAIECARFGAAVIAVERNADACDRIRRNVLAHGVKVALSRGEAPAALEPLPDPDAVFVGGGGLDVIDASAARAPRVLVAALAALERVPGALEILRGKGYHAEGIQLQSSRLAPLPDGTHRLAGTNPVILIWGTRAGGTR
jgi:precorrin-6Y C5,15-methyltransferase (decarboxylating)